jgi:hypothetical protein
MLMELKDKLATLYPLYKKRREEFIPLLSAGSETLRALASKCVIYTDVSLNSVMGMTADLPGVLAAYDKNMTELKTVDDHTIEILKQTGDLIRGPFPEIYAGHAAFVYLYSISSAKSSENIRILHALCLETVEITIELQIDALLHLYAKDETRKVMEAILGMVKLILHVVNHHLGIAIAGGEEIFRILTARTTETRTTDHVLKGLEDYQDLAWKFCLASQLFRLSNQTYANMGTGRVSIEAAQKAVTETIEAETLRKRAILDELRKGKNTKPPEQGG